MLKSSCPAGAGQCPSHWYCTMGGWTGTYPACVRPPQHAHLCNVQLHSREHGKPLEHGLCLPACQETFLTIQAAAEGSSRKNCNLRGPAGKSLSQARAVEAAAPQGLSTELGLYFRSCSWDFSHCCLIIPYLNSIRMMQPVVKNNSKK